VKAAWPNTSTAALPGILFETSLTDHRRTKAATIVAWLKEDFDLSRGHAMALVHVIKNGPKISDKHVGGKGAHRDESDTLRLDREDF
jgi:Domain of unknown function (DUF4287)